MKYWRGPAWPGSIELELLGRLLSMGTEDFRSGGVADRVNPPLHSLETFGDSASFAMPQLRQQMAL